MRALTEEQLAYADVYRHLDDCKWGEGFYDDELEKESISYNENQTFRLTHEMLVKIIDRIFRGYNQEIDWDEVGEIKRFNPMSDTAVSGTEMDAIKADRPPSFLDNWMLKGSYTFIHAASGVGKTPFAMMLCEAMLNGRKFLGWPMGEQKAEKILYMDGELPFWLFKERVNSCFMPPDRDKLKLFSLMRHYDLGNPPLDIMTDYGSSLIFDYVTSEKPDVLVFDNRQDFFSGKESDNDEAVVFNALMKRIRQQGIAIIVNHHQGKGGGYRGASAMVSPVDTLIALNREEDVDNSIIATIEKPRFGQPTTRECKYELQINPLKQTRLILQ